MKKVFAIERVDREKNPIGRYFNHERGTFGRFSRCSIYRTMQGCQAVREEFGIEEKTMISQFKPLD